METLFSPIGILSLIILIYSAILHEIAHGYVAERLGDPTARLLGRLTLNPKPHIDPWMSILLPALLIMTGSPVIFGGAKPVPVDEYNLRDGRRDMALVALAGPMTNILLALAATGVAKLMYGASFSLGTAFLLGVWPAILGVIIQTNIMLAIFNLLPIPPLDGSKVFALLLSPRQAYTYLSFGRNGTFLLLALLFFTPLSRYVGTLYLFTIRLLGL